MIERVYITMDIIEYRALFPHIAEGFVDFNHAGVSAVSSRVVEAVTGYYAVQCRRPNAAWPAALAAVDSCRARVGRLLDVAAENIALTKNTAHSVSIVANGLDWQPGDEVIFADCEYPANSYPWLAQADRGVVVKVVPTQPDGRLRIEDYEAAMTARTRVIAVSWVQFSTGFRVDLQRLAQLAHVNNALILVDVIQGLGAFPINLTELGIDFAASGSQKWLMGPLGVGILYVKPDALSHLRLVNVGALSVKNPPAFAPLNFDPKPTAQRYEEGTPNIAGIIGLDAALGLLGEYGIEEAAERILHTTRYAMDKLSEKGYQVVSPQEDNERAGILLFRPMSGPNEPAMQALSDNNILVVSRGGSIRFAPHFYNTTDDVDRAMAALP